MKLINVILIAIASLVVGGIVGAYVLHCQMWEKIDTLTTSVDSLKRSVDSLDGKFYQSQIEDTFKTNHN